MFSYSRLGKQGNLGNQLFEIASTIGLAKKHDVPYIFPKWEYAKYFQNPIPQSEKIEFDVQVQEPGYTYHDLTLDTGRPVDLLGWFQSEKYWKHCEEKIRKVFEWEKGFIESIQDKYKELFNCYTIAISVRRGDYVGNENYHQLELDYYMGAYNRIREWYKSAKINVLVFSDDYDYCRQHLPEDFHFMSGMSAIEQLALGSLCDHRIIANSSFSWWMAYLGELWKNHEYLGEPKIAEVIAPEFWNAGPLLKDSDDRDVVPERWMKYNPHLAPAEKIDLSDVIFTIPVRYDHPDRKENLDLSLRYLKHYFKTNILVTEMDHSPKFSYVRSIDVLYRFERIGKTFERTRLLNEMAKCDTNCKIIVNWDCDVFIPPKQVQEAARRIRSGEASMVYPYDGRFFRCSREKYYDKFRETLSFKLFDKQPFPASQYRVLSYGGAVMWNLKDFIKGGMENEYMLHYGPEDFERYERFTKLGYRVERVSGPLFHIDHHTGNNGSNGHEYFKANEREYKKIQSMSREQLQAYIKTWHWVPGNKKKIAVANSSSPLMDLKPDKIYCLNLESRTDRRAYSEKIFQSLGIPDVEFFPAVDGRQAGLQSTVKRLTPGMLGCYESHKAMLKDAIEKGYETIIIFEDDIVPVNGFNKLLELALPLMPADWQFAYLGCTEYGGPLDYAKKVNEFWVVPRCAWGTQAYMIRGKEAIKKLYDMINKPQERQIDEELAGVTLPASGLNYYSIFPSAVGQDFEGLGTDIQIRKPKSELI